MPEPIPVIPLSYQNAHDASAEATRPILPTLTLIVCLCGIAALLIHTETVLFSGPLVAILGIWLIVQGFKRHEMLRAILGGVHCTICALFVVMVNLWHWSPGDARLPFLLMSTVHTIIDGGLVLTMWRRFSAMPRAQAACCPRGNKPTTGKFSSRPPSYAPDERRPAVSTTSCESHSVSAPG